MIFEMEQYKILIRKNMFHLFPGRSSLNAGKSVLFPLPIRGFALMVRKREEVRYAEKTSFLENPLHFPDYPERFGLLRKYAFADASVQNGILQRKFFGLSRHNPSPKRGLFQHAFGAIHPQGVRSLPPEKS